MTAKQLYEGVLIELNKENTTNILLEDFNHFANKAINLYINKRYNIYDINLQTTDDLRVLKATAILTPIRVSSYDGLSLATQATYYVDLPSDYLHLLNCICIYNVKKTYKCYNAGDTWRAAATRLTADAYSQVLDNFWQKPSYKKPYYYIHNVNTSTEIPTNPYRNGIGTDAVAAPLELSTPTDGNDVPIAKVSEGVPKSIFIDGDEYSNIERSALFRYGGNVSKVRLEIRYGTDNSVFTLDTIQGKNGGKVYIDYIKAPLHIRLTQEELDHTEDTSLMLEFPDYVCQEILNELVHILLENLSDPRLSTHPVVSLSIANPTQALAPEAAGQTAK